MVAAPKSKRSARLVWLVIVARRGSDNRIEFALQRREADESWSEPLLPTRRFFPAAARVGRWLFSTPLSVRDPSQQHGGLLGQERSRAGDGTIGPVHGHSRCPQSNVRVTHQRHGPVLGPTR